jgi:2-desacetyl-2-hydroxyethyl bacteriochlorophyllide A dehydrogenase
MAIRRSLYFTAPRQVELRAEPLPAPSSGELLVRTRLSAISPGTELLVYRGEAPRELAADETINSLTGSLAFPLKYGYSSVGVVVAVGAGVDTNWLGQRVFAFNPHETEFVCAAAGAQLVPNDVADDDAVFLPNMESAVNFVLDGHPHIGERVAVVGQGVVGLLTTALLARMALTHLLTLDQFALRREQSLLLGAHASIDPAASVAWHEQADLTFELSGSPLALDGAIALTGFNGRVVVGSWYGTKRTPLDLGGRFHRSRIQMMSSQVSTLTPSLLSRWDKARRLQVAWQMLREVRPARLITHRLAFSDAALAYSLLDEQPDRAIQVVMTF